MTNSSIEPGGLASDALNWVFAPRKAPNARTASQLRGTRRGRELRNREIEGYLRANPEATRKQARDRTSELRRKGYVPETVQSKGNSVAITSYTMDEDGNYQTVEVVVPDYELSRRDLSTGGAHRNIVFAFLRHGDNPVNVEKLQSYEGTGVTIRSTGQFIPFEYDPERLEMWYLFNDAGTLFSPEEYYREMAAA